MYLCTWCNIEVHQPIGKRNHQRPRLYGEDPFAAQLREEAANSAYNSTSSSSSGRGIGAASLAAGFGFGSSYSGSGTGGGSGSDVARVSVLTEAEFDIGVEEAWSVLGAWNLNFLPTKVMVSDDGDKRMVMSSQLSSSSTSSLSGLTNPFDYTEVLVEKDDSRHYYRYSRLVTPHTFPYTDHLSKFSLVSLSTNKCQLIWLTSVLPTNKHEPDKAAHSVKHGQEEVKPYFHAAIQSYKAHHASISSPSSPSSTSSNAS